MRDRGVWLGAQGVLTGATQGDRMPIRMSLRTVQLHGFGSEEEEKGQVQKKEKNKKRTEKEEERTGDKRKKTQKEKKMHGRTTINM